MSPRQRIASIAVMSLSLAAFGQMLAQDSNEQARKDAASQTKYDHKADEAQAKADKADHKAQKSHKVKKAARKQDKADREADRANDQTPHN